MSAKKSPTGQTTSSIKNIVKSIFGSRNLSSLDSVDTTLRNMSDKISSSSSASYAELMRDAISNNIDSSIFNSKNYNLLESEETKSRLTRYYNAEEIVNYIPYCARALKVIADGIVSPDNITKDVIQIIRSNKLLEQDENKIADIKKIITELNMDEHILNIVPETLKKGDFFVEFCNYKTDDVPITKTLLSEDSNDFMDYKITPFTFIMENDKKEDCKIEVEVELLVEFDKENTLELINEDNIEIPENKPKKPTEDNHSLNDIKLILHDPGLVVKLQTKKYSLNLGYLILPTNQSGSDPLSTLKYSMNMSSDNSTVIETLYKDVIKIVSKYVNANDLKIDKKEVMDLLKKAIIDTEDETPNKKKVQIRYVPPNRMEHFTLDSQTFFPYGESIFYKLTFPAKMLIALETALTIKRLSDSSEKRIFYIEAGGLPRNVRNMIEEIKMMMKKRRHSIDSLGNISSIPSTITTFEDYYIPTNGGKRYVEFDKLDKTTDIRDVTEELKFLRDNLVAGLNVPPPFLSIEENLSNKSALSHENSIFTESLISHQLNFSKHLQSLVGKIFKYTRKEELPLGISITFAPPKVLQFERESEQVDVASRMIQTLSEYDIPKEYLVKKYLPNIDWEEVEKFRVESKLDKKIVSSDNPPPDMTGGNPNEFGNNL